MSAGQQPGNKVVVPFDLVVKIQIAVWAAREIRVPRHRRQALGRGAHGP